MSTPTLYDNTLAALQELLPAVIDSQLTNLALLVAAAAQTQSAHLGALARALPLDTTQDSKEQRLRRLLDNPRITQAAHYQPVVRPALRSLRGQAVALLIDRVELHNTYNLLVVSVAFRRRSIPLAWIALDHWGNSDAAQQIALLQQAVTCLPADVALTVHGDGEFRSTALFAWARAHGYHAMLGLSKTTLLYPSPDPAAPGQTLEECYGMRTTPLYLTGVYVTAERYGPVNLLLWWSGDAQGEKLRIVLTDLPANGHTLQRGRRRMWIETLFRDCQSGGFHLDQTGVWYTHRLERLLIGVLIAYLLLVSVGRWVVKRGYRLLIDDGASRVWHYSLFQLGVGWMEHLRSRNHLIPIILYIYC